ncbi:MAG TPA: hypothetical protein VFV78_03320 [Vicinamibacterales bacterium]|nr:hypothetical protein [Vicinamibacterales bacterium]
MIFTVQGTNPCGAVEFQYGDGQTIVHPIVALPTTIAHDYTRVGEFEVRVRGQGNCDGVTTTRAKVRTAHPAPPPPPPPPPTVPPGRGGQPPVQPPAGRGGAQPRNDPQQAMRLAEMDRNRDGVITRNEWTGNAQSFAMRDWNGDGRLSGDEVRVGATPPARGRQGGGFNDWTEARFRQFDTNRDNWLSRGEWRYDADDFRRLDRNRDNRLSMTEFLVGSIDEERGDRFDDLDANRNNRLERWEWFGSPDTFRWLDRNNDGVLSRSEVGYDDVPGVGYEYPNVRGGRGGGRTVTVDVSSQQAWTDTGITVRAGDPLLIRASGQIRFSGNGRDTAEPDGARGRASTAAAPMPNVEIGALIGRIGNSAPFLIGSDSGDLRAPRDGRLYLGVNDDILRDNAGQFRAILTIYR